MIATYTLTQQCNKRDYDSLIWQLCLNDRRPLPIVLTPYRDEESIAQQRAADRKIELRRRRF